jgi:hypothetical protein
MAASVRGLSIRPIPVRRWGEGQNKEESTRTVLEETVKYMMIVCIDPTVTEADAKGGMDTDAWVAEMDGRGVRLEGRPLDPSDATTVRVRGGETLISDGPFAETKEFMVGYDMLDCKNLDEAIEVASKHPLARRGAMELRPFGED